MRLPNSNESYETLKQIAERNRCVECGSRLSVAWGGAFKVNGYIIRCTNNIEHKLFARPYEPTGYEIIEGLEKKAMLEQKNYTTAVGLPRAVGLTRKKADEIINSLWGDAPMVEKTKAAMLCVDYGLNPQAKHIFLVPYRHYETVNGVKKETGTDWSLIMGIKGKRVIARRQGEFYYYDETPRLMTDDEILKYYGEHDPDYFYAITIIVDSAGNKFPGYGRYSRSDKPKGLDKGNSHANMAWIHSESQALERFAPGNMPEGVIYSDTAEYEVLPDIGIVNKFSGEIVEGPLPRPAKQLYDSPGITSVSVSPSEPVDRDWVKESLKLLDWKNVINDYLKPVFTEIKADTITKYMDAMTKDEQQQFAREIERRLKVAGK